MVEAHIITVPSILGAIMEHREVDAWRWEPGMLALPVHDAPWWYSSDDHPRYAMPGTRRA